MNAVAPGPIDTGMLDRFTGGAEGKAWMASQVPVKRIGRPEEIAEAIVYLASPAASFVSGHILNVDGAMSAD